jgi:hypothetical protein
MIISFSFCKVCSGVLVFIILNLGGYKVVRTGSGGYFSDIAYYSYSSLCSSEDARAGLFPSCVAITEYLYPGHTKRFMKGEPACRLKRNPVVFNTHADTVIITSEFLEPESRGYISIIGDNSTKEFLPLVPT